MFTNLEKSKIKFCLVGSGKLCIEFTKMLIESGFPKPIIATWPKSLHKRDQVIMKNNQNYGDIFSFSEKNKIEIIETDNINYSDTINYLKEKKVNVIFSIKSRWIIKKELIKHFNGRVINIHQGYLPYERGSVTYSKIMNKIENAGVTIHLISSTVDGGSILYQSKKKIGEKRPSIDLLNTINYKLSISLLKKFINDLLEQNQIDEVRQDNNKSIFMPQFYTEINGAIDWRWNADEIDCFIRAFGPPMPGAFSFYKGKKISILEAQIEKTQKKFHPYFNGRIVTINDDGSIRIITDSNFLIISLIKYGKYEGTPDKIIRMNSTAFLNTPLEILEKARTVFKSSLKMPPPIEKD